MKREWKWTTIPRVVLHDKASYFVNSKTNKLNDTFDTGLRAGHFTSWVDGGSQWLAPHCGDLYLHETVISHVRRLLYSKFARKALYETPIQFAARMLKVEHYLNYEMGEGESLLKLGKELHERSEDLKKLKSERLPKWEVLTTTATHNRRKQQKGKKQHFAKKVIREVTYLWHWISGTSKSASLLLWLARFILRSLANPSEAKCLPNAFKEHVCLGTQQVNKSVLISVNI